MAVTIAVWLLFFFVLFACLRPHTVRWLVGVPTWDWLNELVERADAYLRSVSIYAWQRREEVIEKLRTMDPTEGQVAPEVASALVKERLARHAHSEL
jgi:hypothetical protein